MTLTTNAVELLASDLVNDKKRKLNTSVGWMLIKFKWYSGYKLEQATYNAWFLAAASSFRISSRHFLKISTSYKLDIKRKPVKAHNELDLHWHSANLRHFSHVQMPLKLAQVLIISSIWPVKSVISFFRNISIRTTFDQMNLFVVILMFVVVFNRWRLHAIIRIIINHEIRATQ